MKVRITTTVEIDAQAWALDYGLTAGEVREDVQEWAEGLIVATLRARNMILPTPLSLIPKTDAATAAADAANQHDEDALFWKQHR